MFERFGLHFTRFSFLGAIFETGLSLAQSDNRPLSTLSHSGILGGKSIKIDQGPNFEAFLKKLFISLILTLGPIFIPFWAKLSARNLPPTELMRLGWKKNHSHLTCALCLTSMRAHQRSTYSLLVAARHPAKSEYPLRWHLTASSLVLFLRELSKPSSSSRATSATMTIKAWKKKTNKYAIMT